MNLTGICIELQITTVDQASLDVLPHRCLQGGSVAKTDSVHGSRE
jgi:hypothetical protein